MSVRSSWSCACHCAQRSAMVLPDRLLIPQTHDLGKLFAERHPAALLHAYLQGFSCLHALMRNVWPMSPPSHPENGQSLMILGFTTTSMCTSKSGMISKLSNL